MAPDNEQVAAWYRLKDNDFISNDIGWLMHEYAESILVNDLSKNVVSFAHELLNKNGYKWAPPQYKD